MNKPTCLCLVALICMGSALAGCNNAPAKSSARIVVPAKPPTCDILRNYTQQDRTTFGPPLSYTAAAGDLSSAECLLRTGSDADATAPTGMTPLIAAIKKGHSEMVRLLLRYGANPNKRSQTGEKPLDAAYAKRNRTIIQMLKNAGATS